MWPKPSWSHSVWVSDAGGGSASARDSGGCSQAAFAKDAAALPFTTAAPHPVIDAVVERVLQAPFLHRTAFTDALGDFDADAVGGEKGVGVLGGTVPSCHPVGVHEDLLGRSAAQPPALCVGVVRPEPVESSRKGAAGPPGVVMMVIGPGVSARSGSGV